MLVQARAAPFFFTRFYAGQTAPAARRGAAGQRTSPAGRQSLPKRTAAARQALGVAPH